MDIKVGDQVLVNLAPFIGLAQWCTKTVACDVVDVGEDRIRIMTRPPYREVDLWVSSDWVESVLGHVCFQGVAEAAQELPASCAMRRPVAHQPTNACETSWSENDP